MIRNFLNRLLRLLIPVAFCLAGLYLGPWKMMGGDLSKIPGDLGDARFNNYILEHGYLYLSGEIDDYWNGPFFYPEENVIAWSDNLLGTLPIYAIFRFTGSDRETAFQWWFLALYVLNFAGSYLVLIRITNNVFLSVTGAYLFAFSIFTIGQANHVQVFPRFIYPLIVYSAWRYFQTQKPLHFIILCLGFVYQMYCGIYLGMFAALSIVFMLISYLIVYRELNLFRQFQSLKVIGNHLFALILSVILMLPLMVPYLKDMASHELLSYEQILKTVPTWQSYFFTVKSSLMWGFLSEHGVNDFEFWWIHQIFPGILPFVGLGVAILFLLRERKSLKQQKPLIFFLTVLCLHIVFTLNVGGKSLYFVLYQLPGFGSLRSIDRVINVEILFFMMVTALVLNELSRQKKLDKLFFIILPFIAITDNMVDPEAVIRMDKRAVQERTHMMKSKITSQISGYRGPIAYLYTGTPWKFFESQLDVMIACQELGIRCVNGYSGYYPPMLNAFLTSGTEKNLADWLYFNKIHIKEFVRVY